jgi:O-antigen/teichoic acid export membrane protein
LINSLQKSITSLTTDAVKAFQYHQVVRFAVNLLISILLVKSSLPLSDIGVFESLLFLSGVLTMVWMIGVTQAYTSTYHKSTAEQQSTLFFLSFLLITGLVILTSLMVYLFRSKIAGLFFDSEELPYLELVLLYAVLTAPTVLIEYRFLVRNQARHLVNYTHLNFGLYLILIACALFFHPDLKILFTALLTWASLRFLYLMTLIRFRIADSSFIRNGEYLHYVLSLFVAAFLGVSMDYVDSFLVLHYFDSGFYAVFRYGARELPLSLLLLSSLSNAIVPKLVYYDLQGADIRHRTLKLMHWLFPPAILLMFLSPYLYEWVYNAEFIPSAYIFNIYLLILTSRVLLPQSYCLARKQSRILVVSGVIEIVLNIVLSIWWVNIWGVYGLAGATVTAYMIQKFILIRYNLRVNHIPLKQYLHIGWYAYYTSLLLLAFGLSIMLKQ